MILRSRPNDLSWFLKLSSPNIADGYNLSCVLHSPHPFVTRTLIRDFDIIALTPYCGLRARNKSNDRLIPACKVSLLCKCLVLRAAGTINAMHNEGVWPTRVSIKRATETEVLLWDWLYERARRNVTCDVICLPTSPFPPPLPSTPSKHSLPLYAPSRECIAATISSQSTGNSESVYRVVSIEP